MSANRDAVRILVRVRPNAARSEVVEYRDDRLWVRLAAPPVEGRANEELIRLLSATMGVRKGDVAIIKGLKSRTKVVAVDGISGEEAIRRLLK